MGPQCKTGAAESGQAFVLKYPFRAAVCIESKHPVKKVYKKTSQRVKMGKGIPCKIISFNKQQTGTTRGTLLHPTSRGNSLRFDGTESSQGIIFVRTNKMDKTGTSASSTFQLQEDDTWYVSEQKNSICLKQRKDSSCTFEVLPYPKRCPTWYLIKAKSGKYLTTDSSGLTITEHITPLSPPLKAYYIIAPAHDVNHNYYARKSDKILLYETSV